MPRNNKTRYIQKKSQYSAMAEIGVAGLSEFSGSIREDFLVELRGKEGYKRYNEMRLNSPVISALLNAIEQPLRDMEWTFEAEDEGDPRVEFLQESLDGMSLSWNDHIIEVLTMLPFGFSVFEIVYKRDGAKIMWRKFAPRGQDTVNKWLFDDEGGLAGIEQVAPPKYDRVTIPIEKLLVYRTRVERGNPEGRSILRAAWISYYFVKHLQQIEAIAIEREGAGLPMITLPTGSDTSDSDSSDLGVARKLVRNIRTDEQSGIVKPAGWEFELLSTGGSRAIDIDATIRRHESRMLMTALAQFLTLGQDSVGSLALSRDQTDFFTMSVNSIADNIAQTFTKYAIPRLLELNGFDPVGVELGHTPPGDADIIRISQFLQSITGLVSWRAEDEVWLRQIGGLPERGVEEIRAEQEAEKQRKADAAAVFQKRFKGKKDEEEDEGKKDLEDAQQQMQTMLYVADPPNKRERDKAEKRYREIVQKYLSGQFDRVIEAARTARGV